MCAITYNSKLPHNNIFLQVDGNQMQILSLLNGMQRLIDLLSSGNNNNVLEHAREKLTFFKSNHK